MRFTGLNREATQHLWSKWKRAIREILVEFNEDVFQGKGSIHDNNRNERLYLLLKTKAEFLYAFPLPNNLLYLGVYHHQIPKERLVSKFSNTKADDENLIEWIGLDIGKLERDYGMDKDAIQHYLEKALKRLQKNYWAKTMP